MLPLSVLCAYIIAFVLKPFGNDEVIFLMKTNTKLRPISMKKKNHRKNELKVLLILFIVYKLMKSERDREKEMEKDL